MEDNTITKAEMIREINTAKKELRNEMVKHFQYNDDALANLVKRIEALEEKANT